jgi:hypothetical protein
MPSSGPAVNDKKTEFLRQPAAAWQGGAVPASGLLLAILLLSACANRGGEAGAAGQGGAAAGAAGASGNAGAASHEEAAAGASGSAGAAVAPEDTPPPLYTAHCPPGAREVEGDFCTGVVHRCKKGGRTYKGKADMSPGAYFCDEYEEGYAACIGRKQHKLFCMDEYEYPNRKGAIPRVMVTWFEARDLCKARGERLCGDDEWTLACEGPERTPYAYGWVRDAEKCNIDRPWRKPDDGILASTNKEKVAAEVDRLSQRVPSGSMPGCVSAFGIKDLGGNVDEWTVNVTLGGKPYQSLFKGGHWAKGARNRCRPTTESHDENTAYYAEGFRCCADVIH